ncbi:PREDICTED: vascular cell adhesion protein 1-like [Poecilia mexicana]|uniref:vascular cell adhesion protein 1-like n=1 Tax=Poecilia mexicana TaxID=48701 RepID=UPI00072E71E6|nr:PREDICTED: vascular cell adhesion protein 1-like [Poecilia mexicana]
MCLTSNTHDGYNISCSARYPVIGGTKTAETEVTLNVSYAPKDTSASISPSGLVSAGSWVELSCSSRAKPPPRFTWFRISRHEAINVSVGQVYNFSASEGGEYYCVATNELGNKTSSVILVITKGENLLVPVTVVIIVVICFLVFLVVSIWYFMSKHSAPQKAQVGSQLGGVQNSAFEKEEELHYGEVRIIEKTPKAAVIPLHDNEHEKTVYAEVKVSKPGNVSTQAADSQEKYTEEKKN